MRERLIELISKCELSMWGKTIHGGIQGEREYIADYLLANGVIVPPCKVGDKVYYFSHRPFNRSVLPNTIYEATVVRVVTTIQFRTSLVIRINNKYGVTEIPETDSFGKTVFLTREEAEQALKNGEPICDHIKTNWNDCCECSVKDCCYKYNERSEVIDDLLGEVIGEIKKERR